VLLAGELGAHGQCGHADDTVERSADLVAHVGEELALGLTGALCRATSALEGVIGALPVHGKGVEAREASDGAQIALVVVSRGVRQRDLAHELTGQSDGYRHEPLNRHMARGQAAGAGMTPGLAGSEGRFLIERVPPQAAVAAIGIYWEHHVPRGWRDIAVRHSPAESLDHVTARGGVDERDEAVRALREGLGLLQHDVTHLLQ